MGRWRGSRRKKLKKQYYNQQEPAQYPDGQQPREVDEGSLLNGSITRTRTIDNMNESYNLWRHWRTRDDLLQYLQEYREGCWKFYHSVLTHHHHHQLEHQEEGSSTKKQSDDDDDNVLVRVAAERLIGGVAFPPLTRASFRRPYWPLPAELTKFQRRVVHECCIEQDLFHDSFELVERTMVTNHDGETSTSTSDYERRIVISIYADGFASLP